MYSKFQTAHVNEHNSVYHSSHEVHACTFCIQVQLRAPISPERLAQCLYGTSARGVSSLLHLGYSTRDKLKISKTVMNDDDV